MTGQSFIMATGAITVPGAFQGAASETVTELGVSKVMTLTSTYDHRVIQGAESGLLLKRVDELLHGADGFYDDIFTALFTLEAAIRKTAERNMYERVTLAMQPSPLPEDWATRASRRRP